jgi:hypothetical protein
MQTFGYGTYAFYTASHIDTLDKNILFGMFAYKDDYHEVDIELARWGSANNVWFTVQPSIYKGFTMQLYGDYSTHYFTWRQNSIFFESFGGHYPIGKEPSGNIIQSFTSNSAISAQGARAHLNLWLFNGNAPSNGLPCEVVIKSFQYIP